MPDRPPPRARETIGFVGLGDMGVPMAARLVAAGYIVRGFDSDEGARARFTRASRRRPRRRPGRRAGRAAVILMLPSSAVVSRSSSQTACSTRPPAAGALVVDMSSSEPTVTRELAAEAARRGVTLIDAPVSGGVSGAEAGTLTVMAGGRAADVDRLPAAVRRPRAQRAARRANRRRPRAQGAQQPAVGDDACSRAARRCTSAGASGSTRKCMLAAINGSTGRSYSTEYKLPTFVLPETFASGFSLQLMVKDMRIAAGLAAATGSPLALGRSSSRSGSRRSTHSRGPGSHGDRPLGRDAPERGGMMEETETPSAPSSQP